MQSKRHGWRDEHGDGFGFGIDRPAGGRAEMLRVLIERYGSAENGWTVRACDVTPEERAVAFPEQPAWTVEDVATFVVWRGARERCRQPGPVVRQAPRIRRAQASRRSHRSHAPPSGAGDDDAGGDAPPLAGRAVAVAS